MSQTRSAAEITIDRESGHWLKVPASYKAKVGDFRATRYEGTPDGQARPVQRSLLEDTPMSSSSAGFTFPATGMLPAIRYVADQRGIPIRTMTSAIPGLPRPIRSPLAQNPVIGDFIHAFDAGIIEYGGSVSKAQIVAEVCMAFPGQRILVLSPHRHEIRRIFDAVQRYAPFAGVIDVSRGEVPFDVDDVREVQSCQLALSTPLTTAELFDTSGTDVREVPIVICLDARRARDLMTSGFLLASHARFRVFALRHLGSDLRGEEVDLAHSAFGLARIRVPENGFEQSQVSHTCLPNRYKLRNMPRRPKVADALQLLPHCKKRNDLVADRARCLVDGCRFDDDDLVHHWLRRHHIVRPTVAIIARTFVHAARLAQRLPDWSIFRPDVSAELLVDIKSSDRALISDRTVQLPNNNRIIVPRDYLALFLQCADPQIIVQACGGLQAPTFPPAWFRHPAGTVRHGLVIDFFDDGLPLTRRMSKSRIDCYQPPIFLPIDLQTSPEDQSIGLPLLKFLDRTFKPARRRRSR